jgi:ribosomal protein L37AE/L43A
MGILEDKYKYQVDFADKLQSKYPELFKERGQPHTCMNGAIGVDRGWWPILEEVCEYLESQRKNGVDVYFGQIKEKFAALTIYLDGNFTKEQSLELRKKMEEVHNRSLATCEKCGSTEQVTVSADGGWWLKALCPSCHKAVGSREERINEAKQVLEEIYKEIRKQDESAT